MSASAIEWTDAVWNPVTGCDRVSPGCAHCYALELAPRLRAMHQARGGGKWADAPDGARASSGPAFGVRLHEDVLRQPFRWRKPRRVFVNSMSDLFHEDVPDRFIAEVWGVMAANRRHTFQVLTKRPERARALLTDANGWVCNAIDEASQYVHRLGDVGPENYLWQPTGSEYDEFPALPNVWLGVSIENRRYVHRADVLRDTPAAVRFISAEPLLGPLAERMTHGRHCPCSACARQDWAEPQLAPCGMHGSSCPPVYSPYRTLGRSPFGHGLDGIDWLIVGGESGPRHRPVRPEWMRDLRDAAQATGTAFFFKQWGGRTPKAGGRLLDGRTWDEMPEART